jgi:hypothetical protein
VPRDFGKQTVTWTLTANGETNTVPGRLHPDYIITPYGEPAQGDTPPEVRFMQDGAPHVGPPRDINASFAAMVGIPLNLPVWVQKKPLTVKTAASQATLTLRWSKYRGSGTVTFKESPVEVSSIAGHVTASAVLSAPGEYVLRLEATTSSDRGSNQCCRTNALVKVSVQ